MSYATAGTAHRIASKTDNKVSFMCSPFWWVLLEPDRDCSSKAAASHRTFMRSCCYEVSIVQLDKVSGDYNAKQPCDNTISGAHVIETRCAACSRLRLNSASL